jgi:hypothetical protein
MSAGGRQSAADPRRHAARPWRVHTLAPDFELLDLWELPLAADPARGETFERFLAVFVESGMSGRWPAYRLRPTSPRDLVHAALLAGTVGLLAFRRGLGRLLALDDDREQLAIPGRSEHRVRERLADADRARDTGALPPKVGGAFETVYAFADEALLEIANRTIHALLHLSWVENEAGRRSAVLAVYVKSRGWQSRFYMALINPFRHLVVYPAWISHLTRSWDARRPAAAPA